MINKDLLKYMSHSSVTNLVKSKINNHDAALLVIASEESFLAKSSTVIKALQEWRETPTNVLKPLAFTYLWNTSRYGGYGFVGRDVLSVSNKVFHEPNRRRGQTKECITQRRTYWYRVYNNGSSTGYYRLTFEGFRRLAELQDQLSKRSAALSMA